MKRLLYHIAIVVAALTVPAMLVAQVRTPDAHYHYQLVELPTFGGPNSYFTFVSAHTLNQRGAATGFADTSGVLSAPFCSIDCFVTHAFKWKDGSMTDLGALPGIGASFPNDINDGGVVAGISLNGGFDQTIGVPFFDAVVFKNGEVIDLGTFGGPLSYSAAINDGGEVVGFALTSTPDPFDLGDFCQTFPMPTQMRAFAWQDGVMRDLGTLGGTDSCALFVNRRGQAAGISFTDSIVNPTTGRPTIHPFLWDGYEMADLGTLGGTIAVASAINNHGQVAGASTLPGDQALDAFIWQPGKLTDLGNLGGNFLEVSGFNEVGEVIGKALLPDQVTYHAFLVEKEVMRDLGTMNGRACSYAVQINLRSQIVGYSDDCGGNNSSAVLWESGRITDLNTFVPHSAGVTLTQATSINDRGEITTQGVLSNGDQRGFLLVPCDDDRPSVAGCDYSPLDPTAIALSEESRQVSPAHSGNVPSPLQQRRHIGQVRIFPRKQQ